MKRILLISLFIICISSYIDGQNNNVSLRHTIATWLMSEAVNDSFLIKVYIPQNVLAPDLLQVIIVLDADMTFGMTYDIVRLLNWGREIPPVAIIGISYGGDEATWWQKRSRDYTVCKDTTKIWGQFPMAGGGLRFISFIEDELFPFIEDEYNLTCQNRTLVGLCMGGLISTNILFSKPALFKNYIIAGAALQWNSRDVFKQEASFASHNKSLNACVFSALGSLDNKTIVEPWHAFNQTIKERKYSGLIYQTAIIDNETHLSMYPAALTKGLKFVLNQ